MRYIRKELPKEFYATLKRSKTDDFDDIQCECLNFIIDKNIIVKVLNDGDLRCCVFDKLTRFYKPEKDRMALCNDELNNYIEATYKHNVYTTLKVLGNNTMRIKISNIKKVYTIDELLDIIK